MNIRLPAEWEPQDAVLIAWPHAGTDWAPVLSQAEDVFLDIAEAVTRFEQLIVVTPEPETVREKLKHLERVRIFEIESNDTWARDFGPITIYEDGQPVLLDFTFTGWGGKFEAALDNQITAKLHAAGAFGKTPLRNVDLILEGGSIESDGAGTLLTTAECLLNPNRNAAMDKTQVEDKLTEEFAAKKFQWLENGWLAGDDTDAHIDTLARLCPDNTLLYVQCPDPADEHFPALQAMERELKTFQALDLRYSESAFGIPQKKRPEGEWQKELKNFQTLEKMPYRLLPLPWPQAKFDDSGERLPATYANFLIINGAVLVPTYNDPADFQALETVKKAFPNREIIGIDCSVLILQHGSLHCVTMQIPKGVL